MKSMMSAASQPEFQYQVGDPLLPKAPTYVVRPADQVLCEALLARDYCSVLEAHHSGKSSLRLHTMAILRQQEIACADIELDRLRDWHLNQSQWYDTIIQSLANDFGLTLTVPTWLQEQQALPPVQQLEQFIETVLLREIQTPIVIFMDGIDDELLELDFPITEFFALIRRCYDQRTVQADYNRLTFALFGVIQPRDLGLRSQLNPFSISRAISLSDLQLSDCDPLKTGLEPHFQHPDVVLQEVLYWTGGQPFLTQKLCGLLVQFAGRYGSGHPPAPGSGDQGVPNPLQTATDVTAFNSQPNPTPDPATVIEHTFLFKTTDDAADEVSVDQERAQVAALVSTQIIQNWAAQDQPNHLRHICDRILDAHQTHGNILELYQAILQHGGILANNTSAHWQLRLSGLVTLAQGQLTVKNPIYATIFDQAWIEQERASTDPTAESIQTLTAAIVFTDVKGFTSRMSENERHTLKLVQRDFALMNQICHQFGGTLLKSLGDGLLLSFETAEAAVQWALEVQKTLADNAMNLPIRDVLWHRIGIHWGDVFFSQHDVMGTGVNLAARLQTQSPAGGIALSQEVYDAVHRDLTVEIIDLGEQQLKGLAESIRVYQVPPYQELIRHQRRWWRRLPTALAVGVLATGLILGVRATGAFQRWELRAFDLVMRMRPAESMDDRLFLITVTEADVQAQPAEERGGSSLSDGALAQLLTKLEQGQPRTIGLDIYREKAVDPVYPDLAETLTNTDQLFAICQFGDVGVPPPPELVPQQQGFNNVQADVDGVLRRQILVVGAPEPCGNWYSLNWMLAIHYLAAEGINMMPPDPDLQVGTVTFPQIPSNTGGYHGINAGGQQILINYRATPQIAPSATLTEFLDDQFDPSVVRDRIVLIGTVAPSFNDHNWPTPYSGGWRARRPMAGMEVQAHMTSQILSAVLDDRPLLWSWSEPIEMLWIGGWALAASLVAVQLRSRRWLSIYLGGMIFIVGGICWILICIGGWIPFVPASLAIVTSGVLMNGYRRVKANRAFKR